MRLPYRSFSLLAVLWLAGCGPMSGPRRIDTHDLSTAVDAGDGGAPSGPCGRCAPPTSLCDVKAKRCVGCLSDNDCPVQSICMMSTCMPGCSARRSECGDAGSCDTDMGLCHGCLRDKDCADPKLPSCDLPTGRCAECNPQNDRCPAGTWCALQDNSWRCLPGCRADIECQVGGGGGGGASWACCNHVCVDTLVTAPHCGGCGMDCKGNSCCAGNCVDTRSDLKNCGACGKACAAINAVPVCTAGVCGVGGCAMGFSDCNRLPNDGCEVNTGGDTANCGGCGKVCNLPNSNPLCIGGMCVNGGCKGGFRDCDGVTQNGCEVNVNQDPNNCGVCGQRCAALPHGVGGCMNGGCSVVSCDAGWGNCNKQDNDGCEKSLGSDPANCGACGQVCPVPANVIAICANGVCGKAGCVQGFGDCNNNMVDGCEAKFASDGKNCGGCGVACGALPNGSGSCVNGACTLGACNAGFADCDKNIPNGCEVNLNTDFNNCGACGKACLQGQMCAAGVCGGGMKCSDVAKAWCANKGWQVAAWGNAWPNQPGGAIFCCAPGTAASADCNACNTYNQLVWKNSAKDACNSAQVLVPGNIYGGHNPCSCQPNLLNCGQWNMMGCMPD